MVDTVLFYLRPKKYDFACSVCGGDLTLTAEELKEVFNYNSNVVLNASEYVKYFNEVFKTAKINTHDMQAKLFAQILAETDGLKSNVEGETSTGNERDWSIYSIHYYFKETLGAKLNFYNQAFWDNKFYKIIISSNYYEIVDTAKKEFGNYFSNGVDSIIATYRGTPQSKYKVIFPINFEPKDSSNYKRFIVDNKQKNRQNMFNYAYENSSGNRKADTLNPSEGDGWKYRGRGAIQITGRSTFQGVQDIFNGWSIKNINIVNDPTQVSKDVKISIYSAVAFIIWKYGGNLEKFKNQTINEVSFKVNGGINGLQRRVDEYIRLTKKGGVLECQQKL